MIGGLNVPLVKLSQKMTKHFRFICALEMCLPAFDLVQIERQVKIN